MRDLSLHVLDVIENSLREGAAVIFITVVADEKTGLLTLSVEDDGPGVNVPMEVATDPFYTTKSGKRGGLGLSLLRATAERAGGSMAIERSPLGGAAIRASMELHHIDRCPMGNLAASLAAVVCTHPEVDWRFRIDAGDVHFTLRTRDLADELSLPRNDPLALAKAVQSRIKSAMQELTL